MRHRLVAAAGVVAGLALLSGCTPPWLPLSAVWMGPGGQPVVTVRLCDDDHASSIRLHSWPEDAYMDDGMGGRTENPTSTALPGDPDTSWRNSRRVDVVPTTFPLFSPPAAWHLEKKGPQRLRPGRTYSLKFAHVYDNWHIVSYYGWLYFTADDLDSLGPGQVWADGRAMSREDFDAVVADAC